MKNINQAICESRESTKVLRFVDETQLKPKIVEAIKNGAVRGVYEDENGDVVAEYIWGAIHKNILKK